MTGEEIAQIITSVAALIGAVGSSAALVLGVLNRSSIKEVKHATDGLSSTLVKVTGEKEYNRGVADTTRDQAAEEPVKVEIVKIPPMAKT